VLTLLELLQSGGIRTMAELADRLGVQPRTVRRYVDHLIDLDLPVESVRGRYGGYRLAAGYRLPPLMLSDDEALAVLLGLVAGRRAGLATATGTASETAATKIRRVLPSRVSDRLDAVLASLAFTTEREPAGAQAPSAAVLLTVADAVRHHRPISIRYTSGGRPEQRPHARRARPAVRHRTPGRAPRPGHRARRPAGGLGTEPAVARLGGYGLVQVTETADGTPEPV
jgi:predicted DNA-binding transcriptional regulator YafY